MAEIKKYKPTSPGRRGMTSLNYKEVITTDTPEKSLLAPKKSKAGRNNDGHITIRHRGGGVKQKYRIIDFKRDKFDIEGKVASIEYDPNRTANIALIHYADGEKRYILAPKELTVGMKIMSGEKSPIKVGNALPIGKIPEGTFIHNIEIMPFRGGQLARSAGTKAQILGLDETGRYVIIRLRSGEVRKVLATCYATIGEVGNAAHSLVNIGKAGRNRHKGKRPTVRGSVMNPNDHPHGGGEGKQPIGHDAPRSPWGWKTLGVKTRNKKKQTNHLIVRDRHQAKKR